MIQQLLYHSRATREMSQGDLHELLVEARDLNQKHGITGLLLYIEQHFMQCIEGEADRIRQLATNIRNDRRNTDFSILLDQSVADRTFPGWSMGFRAMNLDDLRNEPEFRDINDAEGLARLGNAGDIAFSLMASIYRANAGRGF